MVSEISRHMMPMFQELPMISEENTIEEMENSCGWVGNMMLMVELRKKIIIFRDFIDLPPSDPSISIHNLMMRTVEDLYKLFPKIVPQNPTFEKTELSIHEGLIHLYNALRLVEASWAKNNNWISNFDDSIEDSSENVSLDQLVGRVLTKLHHMIKIAREMFDIMDEGDDEEECEVKGTKGPVFGDMLRDSYSENRKTCPSPDTPTALSPEFAGDSFLQPFLLPHRIQSVRQLKLLDKNMRCFSFDKMFLDKVRPFENYEAGKIRKVTEDSAGPKGDSNAHRPPPPLSTPNCPPPPPVEFGNIQKVKGDSNVHQPPPPPSTPNYPSPPPVPVTGGPPQPVPAAKEVAAPPPPPPEGMAKALKAKRANAKLKRSSQMGKLYNVLKGKLEGRNSRATLPQQGKKGGIGASPGGKQGMAEAIAEITKRSTYFRQIEEDIKNYSGSVLEVKAAITGFQTKDMAELVKFHRYVEERLEKLTDETQVLAKFEGFPTKKLEALRMAATLYSRLEGIRDELVNWKIEPPLNQLLDKVESYFNKIKEDIDALERSKDEETKRFRSQNIQFDFGILDRIKESMVDVSSGCMELALKERRDVSSEAKTEKGPKARIKAAACVKMLWRAFQLAFRVYNFAGGQDDRADQLSKELAQEIESDPPEQ